MTLSFLLLIIALLLAILSAAGVGGRWPLLSISVILTIVSLLLGTFRV